MLKNFRLETILGTNTRKNDILVILERFWKRKLSKKGQVFLQKIISVSILIRIWH
jgi:hypothetical protein